MLIQSNNSGIFILFPGSKNTQRIGNLLLIASIASKERATELYTLSDTYHNLLTFSLTVPRENISQVKEYLNKRNLNRKYHRTDEDNMVVEVQDWLLSDPALPSGTGAEKEDTRPAINIAASSRC